MKQTRDSPQRPKTQSKGLSDSINLEHQQARIALERSGPLFFENESVVDTSAALRSYFCLRRRPRSKSETSPTRYVELNVNKSIWPHALPMTYPICLISTELTVKLEPFQILYITNGNDHDEVNSLAKMTLLQATRDHMITTEFGKHISFESLSLFQSIRSDDEDMFGNCTHVAFGGSATYYDRIMTREQMQIFEYLCFLGKNETVYVDKLRALGWNNLQRALLMTVSGDMVDYVDGTMVEMDMSSDPASASDTPEQMDEEMSKMFIYIAVFVPLSVIGLVGVVYGGYLMRNNVKWNKPLDSKDPIWQRNHPQAKRLRRLSLEIQDDTDDNASDLTPDMASVKVAVAKRTTADDGITATIPRRLSISSAPAKHVRVTEV